MAKRKLSPDEMDRIAEERRASAHPDKILSVRADDETEENREPIVWVHHIGEHKSKDWNAAKGPKGRQAPR